MMGYANILSDLKSPPSNRLELLKGQWKGWYSIRINNQWRIVFKWNSMGPFEVAIIDYH
jgi:proteic killer suppression protein